MRDSARFFAAVTGFAALSTVGVAASAQLWPVGNLARHALTEDRRAGSTLLAVDLDADGRADLLVYGPVQDQSGAVSALRSTGRGLEQLQGLLGLPGERKGQAMVGGRFDSNPAATRTQIAVGSPGGSASAVGGFVTVVRLGPSGNFETLSYLDAFAGQDEVGNEFGLALAAGDFNGDGAEDLAIGIPGFDRPGGNTDAGEVNVFFGGEGGIDVLFRESWNQTRFGVPDTDEPGDRFGAALVAGDFDGDGFDDLAIAAPWEDVGAVQDAGAVTVIRGSADGLTYIGSQWLTQGDGLVPGAAQAGDLFGQFLAAGRLRHDGAQGGPDEEDELVLGAPWEGVGGEMAAGAVVVLVGRAGGFTAAGARLFNQSDLPNATPEAFDFLGAAFAVADFDRDGWADLAVGAPGEDFGGVVDHGVVHVVRGGANSLHVATAQLLALDAAYAIHPLEEGDVFASALAAADLDGDGPGDLVAGIPGWEGSGEQDAGAFQILFGALFADGFDAGNGDAWSAVTP